MNVAIAEVSGSHALMTADELFALPDANNYELINGSLMEHEMGFESSQIALHLSVLMFLFNQAQRLGWVQGSECGFQLPLPGGHTVRKPDISFISFQRLPAGDISRGYPAVAPDLAVEVISPDDLAYEVESKINEYLRAGVRLIWIINPAGRSVHIYRQDGTFTRMLETEELDGEEVLPGFRCSITRLFEMPSAAQ